jgi:hypothetical protein
MHCGRGWTTTRTIRAELVMRKSVNEQRERKWVIRTFEAHSIFIAKGWEMLVVEGKMI